MTVADVQVAVVGAGSAGIACARRLLAAGRTVQVLEARSRVGGRAWTIDAPPAAGGVPLDMGCAWLHSADRNPLVAVARDAGLTVDEYAKVWAQDWSRARLGDARFRDLRDAFEALYEAGAAPPAEGRDASLADLLPPDSPWRPYMEAVFGWVWGGPLAEISAADQARAAETEVNWRLAEGYGRLFERLAEGLPLRLSCAVETIDLGGEVVRLSGGFGSLTVDAVVVSVPIALLASGRPRILPALPEPQARALDGLRLGSDNKVFFAVSGTPFGPPEDRQIHTRHDEAEALHVHLHPFGRPIVDAFMGGHLSQELEHAGAEAMVAFVLDELAAVFGSDVRKALSPIAVSRWGEDPFSRGAYSYALPGHGGPGPNDARSLLATPHEGRLFFAGEACSLTSPASAHGAWETGLAAAAAVIEGR